MLLLLKACDNLVRQTQRSHLSVRHIAGHDLEIVRHDVGAEPTLFERTIKVLLDLLAGKTRFANRAHSLCELDQAELHVLVAHADVLERTPIHQTNCTRGKSLGELICSTCSTLSAGSRCSGFVGEALNHRCSVVNLDAGVSEQTDVSSHVAEVVDGLIGVLVQRVKIGSNLFETGSVTGGVRENSLNRAHLELILSEAFHDRVDRERLPELNTSIDRSVGDVG